MAHETVTRLVDDLDHSEASTTIRFAWRGTDYEIDLNDAHVREMERAVEPYLAAARRTSVRARRFPGTRSGRRGKPSASTGTSQPGIREWAAANGYTIANRGRISTAILDAFHAAQNGGTASTEAAMTHPEESTEVAAATARPARKRVARKASRRRPRKTAARAAKKATRRARAKASESQ